MMISRHNEKQRRREGEGEEGEGEEKGRRVRELLGMIFNTLYANEATVYRKHAASVSGRGRFVCLSRRRSLILRVTFANFKTVRRAREMHFRNVFIVGVKQTAALRS